MGIIQQQSIKGTFYLYAGVIVGFVSTIALTHSLSSNQNGLISLLVSYSDVLATLATLGFSNFIGIVFPYFRDKQHQHKGFFFILTVVLLIGSAVSVLLYYLLKFYTFHFQTPNPDTLLFWDYFTFLLPLILFRFAFILFDKYYTVLYNAVIGIVLKEFVQRIFILASIGFYFYGLVSFDIFIVLYVSAYIFPTLFIAFSLWRKKEIFFKPQLHHFTPQVRKQMYSMSFYGLIIGFNTIAILRVDTIMISQLLGLSLTGIYTITFYFATLIKIPARALTKIVATIFADAWKSNDYKMIETVYFKSSVHQFLIAVLLFIGIWANIENIFHILPPEYQSGRWVIFFIGISALFEMLAGGSALLISTSRQYRMLSVFMFVLLVLLIVTNFIFIPLWGMNGAAFASALSTFIYFLIRYLYILKKYKMNGLGKVHIKILSIGIVSYLPSYFLPEMKHFILDIFVRSSLISLVFGILVYFSNISTEVNDILQLIKNKLFLKK